LAKDAINAWDIGLDPLNPTLTQSIFWKELWKMLSDAADGGKTTLAATIQYNTPSDFRFPGGFVRLKDSSGSSSYYSVISPEKAELLRNETEEVCFFTGNDSATFHLNFITAPTAGLTIEYPYYKIPTIVSSPSDKFEMSDPWFAVYLALAKLHEYDGEGDRAGVALAKASGLMKAMKNKNNTAPYMQENYVPDRDFEVGRQGFGK
jgi:hypothetical protein